MNMTIEHRVKLSALARLMLPGDGVMPAGDTLGLHQVGGGVDRVLAIEPAYGPAMVAFLDTVVTLPATMAEVEVLAQSAPRGFAALGTVLANAYFMEPATRAAIGYPGQEALDSSVGLTDGDRALLAPVAARGPIWRAVPPDGA
jgi:hypothetical protein